MHNPFVEVTGLMAVNAEGEMIMEAPSSLSHVEALRRDMAEVEHLVLYLTGWSAEDLSWNKVIMGAQWIRDHTGAPVRDVMELMTQAHINGWWRLHWLRRDEGLLALLNMHYCRELREGDAIRAQQSTRDKYLRLHLLAHNKHTYHYRMLEESYSKLF